MFTIVLDGHLKKPLYEQLYLQVRARIEGGMLHKGEKLPSKRSLASHLHISKSTVENAYGQLLAEGYIESIEKRGYFVLEIAPVNQTAFQEKKLPSSLSALNQQAETIPYPLSTSAVDNDSFPYSTWSSLLRKCLREEAPALLNSGHPQGDVHLREEIARYLFEYRGIELSPEQIVIGAGVEYLIGLIAELLPSSTFGLEDPGFVKIARILKSKQQRVVPVPIDEEGITLPSSPCDILFTTPAHQFPTGRILSASRRSELLLWASKKENRYIIEDDYNSEFRYTGKPIFPLFGSDTSEKVIYLGTFAQTLASSLRIAYMVLPPHLLLRFRETLPFYSCTVSQFEQFTLKNFLKEGHYGRHLHRMKKIYRSRQSAFLSSLSPLGDQLRVSGTQAGLHLLLTWSGSENDRQLAKSARSLGVGLQPLSNYYLTPSPLLHTVVAGFAGYPEETLQHIGDLLSQAWSAPIK